MASFSYRPWAEYSCGIRAGVDLQAWLTGSDIKLRLVPSTYTPDRAHVLMNQIAAAAGSTDIIAANGVVSWDAALKKVKVTFDNPLFSGLDPGTAIGLAFYLFVTNDADSPPLFFFDTADVVDATSIEFSVDGTEGAVRF